MEHFTGSILMISSFEELSLADLETERILNGN
jgi:hypothetical protein